MIIIINNYSNNNNNNNNNIDTIKNKNVSENIFFYEPQFYEKHKNNFYEYLAQQPQSKIINNNNNNNNTTDNTIDDNINNNYNNDNKNNKIKNEYFVEKYENEKLKFINPLKNRLNDLLKSVQDETGSFLLLKENLKKREELRIIHKNSLKTTHNTIDE